MSSCRFAMRAPFVCVAHQQTGCHGRCGIMRPMGKRNQPPAESAAAFGVGQLTRHLFVCIGPDCVDPDDGEETWEYVKKRMKELNIAGKDGPFYRTKCRCLRICAERPHCGGLSGRRVVSGRDTRERGTHHPATPDRWTDRRRSVFCEKPAASRQGCRAGAVPLEVLTRRNLSI